MIEQYRSQALTLSKGQRMLIFHANTDPRRFFKILRITINPILSFFRFFFWSFGRRLVSICSGPHKCN